MHWCVLSIRRPGHQYRLLSSRINPLEIGILEEKITVGNKPMPPITNFRNQALNRLQPRRLLHCKPWLMRPPSTISCCWKWNPKVERNLEKSVDFGVVWGKPMRLHGVNRRSRWRRALLFLTAVLLIISLLAVAQVAPWRRTALEQTVSGENVSPRPITRFAIGAFLQNLTPGNVSHCLFPLGNSENFSIPDELVSGSPELGDKSPYRVVYHVVTGKTFNESRSSVTFATHATLEYIVHIAEMARAWQGPVSVACYLPGKDITPAFKILEMLCACEPAMKNVSVHLVYHAEYPTNATSSSQNSSDTCPIPKRMLRSERPVLRLPYPVNVARNVARQAVRT